MPLFKGYSKHELVKLLGITQWGGGGGGAADKISIIVETYNRADFNSS